VCLYDKKMEGYIPYEPHQVDKVKKVGDDGFDAAVCLSLLPRIVIQFQVGVLNTSPVGGKATKKDGVGMEFTLEL
jgi:hypothetical protein